MKQKRYWIWILVVCIIAIVVLLIIILSKNKQKLVPVSVGYNCGMGSGIGQFGGFMIETRDDGLMHFRIPSKPPQTDIIVTKTPVSYGYEYKGDGVTMTEVASNVVVNYFGKTLLDCHKN